MVNKCSVKGCKSNYRSNKSPYVPVYKLPEHTEDKKRWMEAISDNVENITRNTRICRLHWPPNEILMVRIKRFTRPKDPPTVFVSSTSTMERCKSSKSRDIYSRKIALEVRGAISDEIEMFEARDCICSFEDLKNNVGDKLTDDEILFKVADDCIHIFI